MSVETTAGRFPAAVIGLLALIPRLAYIALAGGNVTIQPGKDAVTYDQFARLMMSGWHWVTTPLAVREPLYPAFMAFSYVLPGSEIGTLQLLQALSGAATVVVVYLSLRSILSERIALITGLLLAFNPHFIVWTPEPLRENLVVPLLAASLMCFLLAMEKRRMLYLFLHVFFYVLLVHTDVRFLVLIVVAPAMAYVYHRGWRLALKQALWIWLFFVLLMVPYQVRGYLAFRQPVIVTERFLGKWLGRATSVTLGGAGDAEKSKSTEWLRNWEMKKKAKLEELDPVEREMFLAGERPRTDWIGIHWTLFKEYWRFVRFGYEYRPYPDGRFESPWSLKHNLASGLVMAPFILLFPFVFIGASVKARDVALSLLVFMLAHCGLHVLVHAIERYRVPLEVIMAVMVAIAIENLWNMVVRRRAVTLGQA